MSDTSPEVAAEFDALMARRSGSERVRMACEMFSLARSLAISDIRGNDPTIGDDALRVRLFERLYGEDFSEEERAQLVSTLMVLPGEPRPVEEVAEGGTSRSDLGSPPAARSRAR